MEAGATSLLFTTAEADAMWMEAAATSLIGTSLVRGFYRGER
jgi:hypothetical protein